MKKTILLITLAALATLSSCGGKGVCTCTEDGVEMKTYYEDLSGSEKKANKLSCNGERKIQVVKVEVEGQDVSEEFGVDAFNEQQENCEWSKK